MTYKTEEIEGIGPQFAERLGVVGVHNSDDLLERCATAEGRRQLASRTGLSTKQLETWWHQCDLMRVSGIGSEFGHLLESSGVQSVTELSTRDPENVVNLLHRVNNEKKLTRAVPSLKTVSKWINRARELEPVARRDTASVGQAPASRPEPSMAAGHLGLTTSAPGTDGLQRNDVPSGTPPRLVRPW